MLAIDKSWSMTFWTMKPCFKMIRYRKQNAKIKLCKYVNGTRPKTFKDAIQPKSIYSGCKIKVCTEPFTI